VAEQHRRGSMGGTLAGLGGVVADAPPPPEGWSWGGVGGGAAAVGGGGGTPQLSAQVRGSSICM
jgi:hypothetical protein